MADPAAPFNPLSPLPPPKNPNYAPPVLDPGKATNSAPNFKLTPPPARLVLTNAPAPARNPDEKLSLSKPTPNELTFSGDFLLGQGNVSLPFGFSLAQLPAISGIIPNVAKPSRSSDYLGGTISYSYKRKWYVDFSFDHGTSSGSTAANLGGLSVPSSFSIKDDWYQFYVRRVWRQNRWNEYLRVGASYVQATMTDQATFPLLGFYSQTDNTKDYLGNLGFGVGYALVPGDTGNWKVGVQLEGEGFYGRRSQKSHEVVAYQNFPASAFPTASINNDLYGGIARGTAHIEYRFSERSRFKLGVDVGVEAKMTEVSYPSTANFASQSVNELLWGPYAKAGITYRW